MVNKLRFYCQKILPLVYENSLSYYEVLCKVKEKLNELITNFNTLEENIDEQTASNVRAYIESDEFKNYVNTLVTTYVNNLQPAIRTENSYYQYMFTPYCPEPLYFPQGACFIDETHIAVAYALTADNTSILQKINLVTGDVEATAKSTSYHCNTLTYGNGLIYGTNFFVDGEAGKSNILSVFNPETMAKMDSIVIDGLSGVGVRSASWVDGNLYLEDRDTYPSMWKYNTVSGELTKLFTLPFETWQMVMVDSGLKVWALSPVSQIYVFNIDGSLYKTVSLDGYSSDRGVANIEFENIMQSPNGNMFVTDIGWKYEDKRYNRHIICSLGKQLNISHGTNTSVRLDATQTTMMCSPNAGTYQNGNKETPYDSLDYAVKIGSIMPASQVTLTSNNVTMAQTFEASNINLSVYQLKCLGFSAINSTVICGEGEVRGDGTAIQNRYNLTKPTLMYFQRFCNVRGGSMKAYGDGKCVGATFGYNNVYNFIANFFVDCETPIQLNNVNTMTSYGGHKPIADTAQLTSMYRTINNPKLSRVGTEYGARSVNVMQPLNNDLVVTVPNMTINASAIIGINVNYSTVYVDTMLGATNFSTVVNINDNSYIVQGSATFAITDNDAKITFGNIKVFNMNGTTASVAPTVRSVLVF